MKNRFVVLTLAVIFSAFAKAQEYFPNNDDVSARNKPVQAFTNATITISPGEVLENGTMVVTKGIVTALGSNVEIPENAVVHDLEGSHIYPSFIEAYGNFGMEDIKGGGSAWSQQYDEGREGHYWNDHIRAEQDAASYFSYDKKEAKALVKAGFGVVQTHLHDGIARGNGLLVALNENASDGQRILKSRSGAFFAFDRSGQTSQSYPTSLMGMMALLRQAHWDANWYAKGHADNTDLTLEAMNRNKDLVQIFHAGDKKNVLRADQIGDKVGKQFVIVGGEDAYEMINAIKKTNATLIIPVNFPAAYDVSNPYQAEFVSLGDMREWQQAPGNPRALADAGINFAITAHDLKSPAKLMEKIRQAMEYGLTEEQALAALTTIPAEILRVDDKVGSLKRGMLANFLITSGPVFDKETSIYENWVQGQQHILKNRSKKDIDGTYTMQLAGDTHEMKILVKAKKINIMTADSTKLGSKIMVNDDWVTIVASAKDTTEQKFMRLIAKLDPKSDNLRGKAYLADGGEQSFVAVKQAAEAEEKEKKEEENKPEPKEIDPIYYPNIGMGYAQRPQQETVLYRNATVWTNEADGILENTDVLVRDGKISKIGNNLKARGACVIDATGKHLTSGIIDEHSHIAIDNGVNEAGHNSSAEVTIEDVVDHEDINIYRNLAGGVTTAQLLHGSANPIGGRSAIIKMKWGYAPQDMIYDNSPKFIKFALGENVKQSRYQNGKRFPQTRMGVEQVFRDYFIRAREYDASRDEEDFRYDEEMEVILEVMNSERFVTSHSYIQSEIVMLMRVAEEFGFNINTFTHILEGYKVADKMKEHGVGGSTFSDWWAYKFEVSDAIPYNGAVMHKVGVLTAFNSDDAEMSRHLNQEAAKAVKYGDISEEDAWKFVTLNPAKLLHLDDRTGSIKKGKDADLVLWSDNPLSVTARAEITMVDGAIFFSLEKDQELRKRIKTEKQKYINAMIEAKNKGLKTRPVSAQGKTLYECNTLHW